MAKTIYATATNKYPRSNKRAAKRCAYIHACGGGILAGNAIKCMENIQKAFQL
ncbi:hypothetical protein AAF134_15390 [Synechococcus lacustris Tous-12m]